MPRCLLLAAVVAAALAGCSGERTLNCETAERYAGARSVPPVRVPDDLSVPDETDSLRLPPEPSRSGSVTDRCLESPPDFFENRPGSERRAADPAAEDASEPEPEDPERRIDN